MTRLTIIAAAALALFAANAAQAQEYHSKDLTISNSWARPAGEGQYSAVYLTIKNAGQEADTFISAESPVAEKTQVHETRNEDGVMKMRAVKDGIEIKPGSSLEFKPGGYHIMLLGLKKTLEAGATAPLTITLAKAGAISMEIKVEKTAPGAAEAHPMDMHGMKGMDHSAHLLFGAFAGTLRFVCIWRRAASVCQLVPDAFSCVPSSEIFSAKSPFGRVNAGPARSNP